MKHTLTEEASLFFINSTIFEEFSIEFEKYVDYSMFSKGLLQKSDVIHNSLNMWLIMLSENNEVMESMEKTMYYTGDFLIFDAIRKNQDFKMLLQRISSNKVLQVQMAVYLANQLNIWLGEKLGDLKNFSIFNDKEKHYFLLYKELDLWENRDFLDEVAVFTKKVSTALSDKNSFNRIFKKMVVQIEQLSYYNIKEKQA